MQTAEKTGSAAVGQKRMRASASHSPMAAVQHASLQLLDQLTIYSGIYSCLFIDVPYILIINGYIVLLYIMDRSNT